MNYLIHATPVHPSLCLQYQILLFTIDTATVFILQLLLLFYYCHYYKTVATAKPLWASLFPGAPKLITHLSRVINILWLPLCQINKFGFYFPWRLLWSLYLWVISNQSTKYFTIANNKSLVILRHRYNRSWENNRLYHTSVCQEITVGDQDGVAVDDDDEHARGGCSPPEAIPTVFPPPNSFGNNLLSLYFYVFNLRTAIFWECPWDLFYSGF
jgi:hypothetical protein